MSRCYYQIPCELSSGLCSPAGSEEMHYHLTLLTPCHTLQEEVIHHTFTDTVHDLVSKTPNTSCLFCGILPPRIQYDELWQLTLLYVMKGTAHGIICTGVPDTVFIIELTVCRETAACWWPWGWWHCHTTFLNRYFTKLLDESLKEKGCDSLQWQK